MERFLKYFVPEKYVLDLVVDKNAKTIGGKVVVSGEVKNEVVKFHAVNLEVTDVLINGEKCKFKADGEVLTISDVNLGNTEIEILYNGKLNENMESAYLSTYEHNGKTETIVATQFESHYAREAFPCIDEPEAKAVFELSITTDKDDMVLSNMPAVDNKSEDTPFSGRGSSLPSSRGSDPSFLGRDLRKPSNEASSDFKTVVFEPTPRMSTYLLAFVIGKFHGKTVTNAHGVEITTYCALNHEVEAVDYANEIAAKALEFYDDNFGVPYPLKKLDQIALPDFEAGAMENWGLVTYRESMMLVGKSATLGVKKAVSLTVSHELSHQWFGDLVTMKWWDDLWLNESFASVMEYFAVDYIHPEYKIFEGFFTGDCYLALLRDEYKDVQSVHQEVHDPAEIPTLFDSAIVYSKGARLMLMTIRLMGWDKFCEGIREYFDKYKYSNTTGDDLWECLGKYAEFDVSKVMHAFIDQPGYPVVTNEGDNFKYFSQKRFLLDGEMMESDWPLIEIREDMTGHYILNLSDAEFEERLNNFDQLGLEEKIRLLIDRNLVTKTDLAPSASLVPLIQRFKDENLASVWGIVLSIVSNLKYFFENGSEEEKRFKKLVGELVAPKLKEVGLTTREDDDENTIRLRAFLMGLDYYAETRENLEILAEMYDSDYTKLDKEIRENIIDAKLYLEPTIIDEYLQKYQEIADPELKFELMFAGTLSKDKTVLEKMMALLEKPDVVKPQDQDFLFAYLYRNPLCRDEVFKWLSSHWDYVKKMVGGDKSLDHYPRLTANMVRTEEEFEAWLEFFRPMSQDPAFKRTIEIGRNEIRARLKLIASDGEAVVKAVC